MEVTNGATPILKEVGPYCYNEYKEKINVIDSDLEDTLTYNPYDIFKFNQEKSGNLSDTDVVTIINPLIVGMVNKVTTESPAFLPFVSQAIAPMFNDPKSIYVTAKVKDILFDGLEVRCGGNDFAPKAICSQMRSQIQGLKEINDTIFFSVLGSRNATVGKSVTVRRGVKKNRDVGSVTQVDGKHEIHLWATNECNHFKGTDGWIIPPLLTPEEGIWTYSPELCRNAQAVYINDSVLKGIHVRRYEATLGDMQHNEEDKCYCATPKTCLRKGVYDLSKCMGVPIYATLPHFLYADEIYLQQVKGLTPSPEKHVLMLMLEPLTGTPLVARKRIQFNLQIGPNSKVNIMNNLPVALHPIFWLEEGVELEGPLFHKLKSVFLALKVAEILRWISLLSGVTLCGAAGYIYFKNKKSLEITPIHQTPNKILNGVPNLLPTEKDGTDEKGTATNVMTGREFERY